MTSVRSACVSVFGKPASDLSTRVEAQLYQDVLDVRFGCALGYHERTGDFFVTHACRYQVSDLALAFG